MYRPAPALSLILFLLACGPMPDDSVVVSGDSSDAPGLDRGELLSLSCSVCHSFAEGEGHLIGPNLHGLFGRPAASLPDFQYSPALLAAGFTWTPELLDEWLAEPAEFLPGNNMPFAGFDSATDRAALIAYLQTVTAP